MASTTRKILNKILLVTLVAFLGNCTKMYGSEGSEAGKSSDSIQAFDYSGLSHQFFYKPEPSVLVNESEVRAGLLYDVMNKKIVWQKNLNSAFPIASLTKMMVALLTVEDVNAGKFTWEDNVKWTSSCIVGRGKKRKMVHSTVSYTLRDVFKAAMIASNNECSEQMARFIGNGDLKASIDRMNRRARELGMVNTFYGNPTGLPSPHLMFDNAASPTDLLLLTVEMLQYNEVLDITKMGYAAINNGRSVIRNHNHLTIDFSGEVDGLKTGYTKRAGFCLVATTAKCDHRLVAIVLGCRAPQIRNLVVRDMFNDYYTSIGLDKLGPSCPNPLSPASPLFASTSSDGEYIITKETVKKIHVVKSGENLKKIATHYKCSTNDIATWNKKTVRKGVIRSGQKLVLYTQEIKKVKMQTPSNGSESDDDQPLMTEAEKAKLELSTEVVQTKPDITPKPVVKVTQPTPGKSNTNKYVYHTIVPGDTLFSIAQRYEGVTVSELKTLNKIKNTHTLKPGMRIKVKVQG